MKYFNLVSKIVLTFVIIVSFHLIWNFDRIKIDGFRPEMTSLLYGEDSRYSPNFSHHAFDKIKPGMTKKQVLELVGEPLQIFPFTKDIYESTIPINQFAYKYCVTDSDTNYRLRIVYFKNDTVTEVLKEYYYD